MDASKRIGESSSYCNRDGSESPRKHEDNVSGTKEILRRSKKPRMTTLTVTEKASSSRMKWYKHDQILILTSIIDYEKEFKLSYKSDSEALYRFVEKSVEAKFTKKQLVEKIEYLKKKFLIIQASSNTDYREVARSDTDDGFLFNLSMIIWGKNETQFASVENSNQPKDVPCLEQENREVPCLGQENRDVPSEELERVSMETENAEKEKSEEAGLDELHVLQEIVEAQPNFKILGKFQQKLLLADLGKLEVEKKNELIDEWKTLVLEELQLDIKKKKFSAKLANGGVSL